MQTEELSIETEKRTLIHQRRRKHRLNLSGSYPYGMAVDDEDEELHEKLFISPQNNKPTQVKYHYESNGGSRINFDLEALKQHRNNNNAINMSGNGSGSGGGMSSSSRKHSISSEESLSDYEELGFGQRRGSIGLCSRPKASNPPMSYGYNNKNNINNRTGKQALTKCLGMIRKSRIVCRENVFNESSKEIQDAIEAENLEALMKIISKKPENFDIISFFGPHGKEKINLVKFLLDQKANPNTKDLDALHCAVKANAVENRNSSPYSCFHGLWRSCQASHREWSQLRKGIQSVFDNLIEGGASVDIRNGRGQSALHLAALSQSPETVEILLKSGANPNCGDFDRRTPLHSAIVKGSRSYDCVRLLLDTGADVNHKDRFGYAPLHIAALNEYSYCANMLLAFGADITARTKGGTSALSMIVRKTPNVLPKFEDMLDHAITLAEHDINDVDCELKWTL
ncbi:Transient receptor potential channel pyrexia [Lepeophtheirus salmonis]|uniref:Transient receptor potential channel pyrexia n=1 Tax=Lepeophtheirus salmonis TaxID=72036 RepID=A0A7R8H560_LEPSM|nr:Transient receptor potential channel pyrexia [Lepeophtheirus salmonis]CAF2862006.1 Transient receptor potential channel pyrexia [Lepeophtheirus salmonis]